MNNTPRLCVLALMAVSGFAGAEEHWQYQLSPYIWFAGSKGEAATLPGLPPASFELTPREAFQDNETSYMLIFSAKKSGRGYFLDAQYTDTRSDYDLVPALGLRMESTSKNTLLSAGYIHELSNDGRSVVDAFAGVRYWDIESVLKFKGGLGVLAGTTLKNTEDWLDPLVGINARSRLGDSHFFMVGWLAAGGFDLGSKLFYDATMNVGYQWSESIDTTLGYRVFDVDYEDGDYLYDVKNAGWILGLTWRL